MGHRRIPSIVACFCGSRGSGKTLSMIVQATIDMLKGHTVWSNVPINFIFKDERLNIPAIQYQSKPLDMNAMYSFDSGLAEGVVCLDEIALWVNSRTSMAVSNRLINSMFTLIRKRKLSFYLTVQSYDWLDKNLRFQTDVLVHCQDLAFKYPAREYGTLIGQACKDLSGVFTGYSYEQTGRVYERILHGKPFWGCYDSFQEFDILETMRKVKVQAGTKVITREDLEGAFTDELGVAIYDFCQVLRQTGLTRIGSDELKQELDKRGIGNDMRQVGIYLRKNGFVRKESRRGNYYKLLQEVAA